MHSEGGIQLKVFLYDGKFITNVLALIFDNQFVLHNEEFDFNNIVNTTAVIQHYDNFHLVNTKRIFIIISYQAAMEF